ncbi:MAG: hypothetical protein ACK5MU_01665 [Candidatus Saccharimonadales bacterium]
MVKTETKKEPAKKKPSSKSAQKSSMNVVLIVVLAPIWLPLVIALAAVVLALLISVFAIVVGFGIGGAAVILAGIIYLPLSVITFFQNMPVGVGVLGSGLLAIGIGILMIKGATSLAKVSFGGMTRLVEKLMPRKEQK